MIAVLAERRPVWATAVEQIEAAYDVLNRRLFGRVLPKCEMTFSPRSKHLIRWMPESDQYSIGSELAVATLQDILVQLAHEMVHRKNSMDGLVDCTSNQYHNHKFLAVALGVGLYVAYQKTQGWCTTLAEAPVGYDPQSVKVPESQALKRREEAFAKCELTEEAVEAAREQIRRVTQQNRRPKVYFMKYQCACPGPHNSIRSGRRPDGAHALRITCQACMQPFKCVHDLETN
jgi:hypothetical protein